MNKLRNTLRNCELYLATMQKCGEVNNSYKLFKIGWFLSTWEWASTWLYFFHKSEDQRQIWTETDFELPVGS